MRQSRGRILFGIALVFVGVISLLKSFGYDININFDGWWTIFIIVPSISSMIDHGIRPGNTIGVAIGLLLLANAQHWLPDDFIRLFSFPVILILIGLSLLFGRVNFRTSSYSRSSYNSTDDSDHPDYFVLFGGHECENRSRNLKGANITAIFGGMDIDFSKAQIHDNIKITVTSIFGGSDVYLPSNVQVRFSSVPIFGGNSNYHEGTLNENAPIVTIEAFSLFGGSEVR